MQTYTLRQAKNYNDLILIVESDSFGDQIWKILYETPEGYQKYVWQEINHEGQHREISQDFINYMKNQKFLLHGKVV